MSSQSGIEKTIGGWRIWLAIAFGILVAGWMLYSSISEEQFIPVENQSGDYNWLDKNHDGIVNQNSAEEFIAVPKGEYRKQTVKEAISSIEWTAHTAIWLIIAMLFVVGRDLFYIIRIRLLTHNELSWKKSFRVIMLWEFASAITPGVVGGAAVAMFILNREKIALGRSTAIVIITAMLDNLFYVLLIPFVFLIIENHQLFPSNTGGDLAVQWVFWIGFGVIFSVCLFLFAALFLTPRIATQFLSRLFHLPILRQWKENAVKMGTDLETASRVLRKEHFVFWLKVFGATCASWISRYLVINAILQAFLNLGFIDHVLILGKQLVLWLFMLVSPTPGGSGVAEYAFSELLSSFSSSAILLATMAIIWRLISYFPYLFIGAFMLPRWLGKKN